MRSEAGSAVASRGASLLARLRTVLRRLYEGDDAGGHAFRTALLVFDVGTIAFFLIVTFLHDSPLIRTIDLVIAVVLSADFLARILIAARPWRFLGQPATIADLIVIVTLLAPAVFENYAFLRVLRALRLVRSYYVLGRLRRRSPWIRRNQEVIVSGLNLVVFIFVVTAIVYVTQVGDNPAITNYVDALYFTVTTLTTTGFGDITLQGTSGRLLAVLVMIFGISLFLRLIQTLFRPAKVRHLCPDCGLARHDPDAVHCKHCGRVLNIPNEGD